eukprot:SAG11_NODE_2724_length_3043_cov_1.463315_3_plen_260_part_01
MREIKKDMKDHPQMPELMEPETGFAVINEKDTQKHDKGLDDIMRDRLTEYIEEARQAKDTGAPGVSPIAGSLQKLPGKLWGKLSNTLVGKPWTDPTPPPCCLVKMCLDDDDDGDAHKDHPKFEDAMDDDAIANEDDDYENDTKELRNKILTAFYTTIVHQRDKNGNTRISNESVDETTGSGKLVPDGSGKSTYSTFNHPKNSPVGFGPQLNSYTTRFKISHKKTWDRLPSEGGATSGEQLIETLMRVLRPAREMELEQMM